MYVRASRHAASRRSNTPPGRGMAEQREDEVAMLVEARRLSHDRHHAVGAGQIEERVDVGVRQPMGEHAAAAAAP